MYSKILIRFGELSTKGKNKMLFVRKLAHNIEKLAKLKSTIEFDRIFLPYSPEALEKLQYIFGIYSYSPVIRVDSNLEKIAETIDQNLSQLNGKTFKVITKRNWKDFKKTSNEINNFIGGEILKKHQHLSVKLKNPDINVEIEIRKKYSYVFFNRIKGLGGMPVGINGKILHLLSGGIDSPVAALELMKRGLHVDFLNFITPPHTDQRTVDKVDKIIRHLNKFQGSSMLFQSKYTNLMNLIGLVSNQAWKINLMRRSFYRIADKIAKEHNYLAISNGDNLGQVASQTMESLLTISSQTNLPIYRPLLTADKIDTIEKGKKMGTYDISIEKANESCEIFAPKAPIIKPRMRDAEKFEQELVGLFELESKNINKEIEIKKMGKD